MERNDHDRIIEIEREMASHEAMCDERWKTTFNRLQDIEDVLKKLENRILTASGSIIVFLAGVIITLLMRQPMIYEKRGKWYVEVNGAKKNFDSKEKAMKAAGMVEKAPDPLAALAAKAPVYKSFEDAVDDHGEDDLDLYEEELIAEED